MGMLRDVPENIKDYGEQLRPFAMPVKTWIDDGIRVTFEASGIEFLDAHPHPGHSGRYELRQIGGAASDPPEGRRVELLPEGVDRYQ